MKKQFAIMLFVLAGVLLVQSASAQSLRLKQVENSINKKGKYALLVSNSRHFHAAVLTGEELKTNILKSNSRSF